ncbi:unnamed protein product [marine sediment metagenome]|uniref:Uncharacterized protein n=2 Tax=marine sediment metagenome TaxID=412755 RepID=X1BN21_9ZZZZ
MNKYISILYLNSNKIHALISSLLLLHLFLNLLALGINAATAERSQEDTSLLIVMFIVLILEIVLIAANINFDLASFFGESEKVVAGYTVPLGDIKIVGPIVIAILSIILFVRTRGRYTKWLAAVIFITCFTIVYAINPEIFKNLLGLAVDRGIESI